MKNRRAGHSSVAADSKLQLVTTSALEADKRAKAAKEQAHSAKLKLKAARKKYRAAKKAAKEAMKEAKHQRKALHACLRKVAKRKKKTVQRASVLKPEAKTGVRKRNAKSPTVVPSNAVAKPSASGPNGPGMGSVR